MLPQHVVVRNDDVKQSPTKTYKIDWETKHIADYVDGEDAIKQAVDLHLSTERYQWVIYSWQYGSDLYELIGKDVEFAKIEMQRMIEDALSLDNRISSVSDFQFTVNGTAIQCTFNLNTYAGKIKAEFELNA